MRAKVTSTEVLDKYFSEIENVLAQNNLQNKPKRIWNVDERGLAMEHPHLKFFVLKVLHPRE